MPRRKAYTDAQYRWLWQKILEGYSYEQICKATYTHRNTLMYHLERIGLYVKHKDLPPLDLTEFYALADDEEDA